MNRITPVGDHYAAINADGTVVAVVDKALGSGNERSWRVIALCRDGYKQPLNYADLQAALEQAVNWGV